LQGRRRVSPKLRNSNFHFELKLIDMAQVIDLTGDYTSNENSPKD
jgi:hypothetical protein